MDKLITVSGVTGYIDTKDVAWLNLENVARGLGFTTDINGVSYVRWPRVDEYLSEMGFATSGKRPEFIPENIFYRLAFKAKNAVAEQFQAKVADEILPAIRRTGNYISKPMSTAEMFALQSRVNLEIEQKAAEAIETARNTERKLDGALDALAKATAPDWQISTNERIRGMAQKYQLSYVVLFGDLYKELEESAHVNLQSRVSRLQNRMKKSGATFKERVAVSKLHVIGQDPALKTAFDGIVRRYAAKYQQEVDNHAEG